MNSSINRMINTLSNRVLRLEKANSDSDYSGSDWYEEQKYAIFLYPDFSSVYVLESFSNVSGGNFYLPNQNTQKYNGKWNVCEEDQKLYLELIFDDNSSQKLETENLGYGIQKLGHQVWNRYLIS
ncbi:hypothetical protein MH928_11440 [Flavobacterium sp. WW92]|uniref:hypothetical protein n=1 Tax=unclassified Flavobacterium TaxID=196869 RepID=UPI00222504E8|nr:MULTISPECIES: hypothetical protein [unclassified Flavobacterium]WDO11942.1 hypothetical protein MH928_11440 [Flavobacterium sp. WW92]